jgi:hypothetical protein
VLRRERPSFFHGKKRENKGRKPVDFSTLMRYHETVIFYPQNAGRGNKMKQSVLRTDEKITFKLRELYRDWGYVQYRVGKFEEYDLYMQNKNFLASEQILTFSDTNGKLMALKPDITLSIIKNTKDGGGTKKLFYSEHVYRVPKNAYGFKEIGTRKNYYKDPQDNAVIMMLGDSQVFSE